MPHEPPRSAHSIFAEAAKLPLAARPAFLAAACGADEPLRRRIEMMLAARDAAAGFSPSLAAQAGAHVQADAITPPTAHGQAAHGEPGGSSPGSDGGDDASVDPFADADRRRELSPAPLASILRDVPESHIGPYRLLERLGAGGFGVVFLAQQDRPVRRLVAIKVIKLGMDTNQVIARFEAERQALAIMDHPNIARVFDAGATQSGRPYFVMELVKGVPITQYCDMHELDLRQRLELFRKVCIAVQHAHQKGVIHRDIKPSNVLVTIVDNEPVPKIIDFGIAKATHARLTERTMVTEANQFIGTPEYMSPEQAETTALDIDTRTDIYSLGVLLYELLTGTTPLEPLRLRQAGITALQRMICDEDAPRPSARVESLGPLLAGTARKRRIPPARLAPALRGELDWIALKALEKDRNRRYDTAVAFAADIERHLTNRPVEASPPSRTYRVRKFVQRNRRGVIAAGVVAATLAVGITATGTMLVMWLLQVRHSAEVSTFLTGLFGVSVSTQASPDEDAVERVLADAARLFDDDVGVRDQILLSYGARLRNAGQLAEASFVLTDALDRLDPSVSRGDVAGARMLLALVRSEQGRYDDAVLEADRALDLMGAPPSDEWKRGIGLSQLAAIHRSAGNTRAAFLCLRDAASELSTSSPSARATVVARCEAALLLATDSSVASVMLPIEREEYLRESLLIAGTLDESDPRRFAVQFAVAVFFRSADSNATKQDVLEALLESARLSAVTFGETERAHVNTLRAVAQQMRGAKLDTEALPIVEAMVELAELLSPDDPIRIDVFSAADAIYFSLGLEASGLDMLERLCKATSRIRASEDTETLRRQLQFARRLRMAKDPDQRLARLHRARELLEYVHSVLAQPELRDTRGLREQALEDGVAVCDALGQAADVQRGYQELLQLVIEDRGADHPDAAILTNQYVAWLEPQGRLAVARPWLDAVLVDPCSGSGQPNQNVVSSLEARIRLRKLVGDDHSAARDDVMRLCECLSRLTASPNRYASTLNEQSRWLLDNGFLEDGLAVARRWSELSNGASLAASPLHRATANRRLGEALRLVGQLDGAEQTLAGAIESLRELGPAEDTEIAELEIERAFVDIAASDLEAARDHLDRCDIILQSGFMTRAETRRRWNLAADELLRRHSTSDGDSRRGL